MLRVAAATSLPTYDGTGEDDCDELHEKDRSSFDQASDILNGLDASYIIDFRHIRLETPPIACGG